MISFIGLKRFKRKLKRKRRGRIKYSHLKDINHKIESFYRTHDANLIKGLHFELHNFLLKKGFFLNPKPISYINIPKNFTLKENFNGCLLVFNNICSCIFNTPKSAIVIDFSKCEQVDIPTLFVLQIFLIEYQTFTRNLNLKLLKPISIPEIKIHHPKDTFITHLLLVSQIIPFTKSIHEEVIKEKIVKLSSFGYLTGSKSKKSYLENRKGKVATDLVVYINDCLKEHQFELDEFTKNKLEGIITETLNNAEDHSPFNKWYATASFIKKDISGNNNFVGELDLAFLNFGFSFFEGFEDTKENNIETYFHLETLYNETERKFKHSFTKENLFTLYSLQEGVSRLRYEGGSRGTGTMKFIKSFLALSDFEDKKTNSYPYLSIISGSTQLICDNEFKPFSRNNVDFLSLNHEEDLKKLPSKTHLKHLQGFFPGTILNVRLFLNTEHFKTQINGGAKNNN